jgi:hypothetical protein
MGLGAFRETTPGRWRANVEHNGRRLELIVRPTGSTQWWVMLTKEGGAVIADTITPAGTPRSPAPPMPASEAVRFAEGELPKLLVVAGLAS